MTNIFIPDDFDIEKILNSISSNGATSVKILGEDFRKTLLKEARSYSYIPEDEYVGSTDRVVRQQMSTCKELREEGSFIKLRDSFQSLLDDHLKNLKPYPFDTRLNFNSIVLHRYDKGSIGITSHRDGLRYINLICTFNISGKGMFFTCSDRVGNDPMEFDCSPGNVVMMRAPGFFGSYDRIFHYVTEIREVRYIFGLRQKRE